MWRHLDPRGARDTILVIFGALEVKSGPVKNQQVL